MQLTPNIHILKTGKTHSRNKRMLSSVPKMNLFEHRMNLGFMVAHRSALRKSWKVEKGRSFAKVRTEPTKNSPVFVKTFDNLEFFLVPVQTFHIHFNHPAS